VFSPSTSFATKSGSSKRWVLQNWMSTPNTFRIFIIKGEIILKILRAGEPHDKNYMLNNLLNIC
jgi:hypothetical protein